MSLSAIVPVRESGAAPDPDPLADTAPCRQRVSTGFIHFAKGTGEPVS
jgi:hypothetical protein